MPNNNIFLITLTDYIGKTNRNTFANKIKYTTKPYKKEQKTYDYIFVLFDMHING